MFKSMYELIRAVSQCDAVPQEERDSVLSAVVEAAENAERNGGMSSFEAFLEDYRHSNDAFDRLMTVLEGGEAAPAPKAAPVAEPKPAPKSEPAPAPQPAPAAPAAERKQYKGMYDLIRTVSQSTAVPEGERDDALNTVMEAVQAAESNGTLGSFGEFLDGFRSSHPAVDRVITLCEGGTPVVDHEPLPPQTAAPAPKPQPQSEAPAAPAAEADGNAMSKRPLPKDPREEIMRRNGGSMPDVSSPTPTPKPAPKPQPQQPPQQQPKQGFFSRLFGKKSQPTPPPAPAPKPQPKPAPAPKPQPKPQAAASSDSDSDKLEKIMDMVLERLDDKNKFMMARMAQCKRFPADKRGRVCADLMKHLMLKFAENPQCDLNAEVQEFMTSDDDAMDLLKAVVEELQAENGD